MKSVKCIVINIAVRCAILKALRERLKIKWPLLEALLSKTENKVIDRALGGYLHASKALRPHFELKWPLFQAFMAKKVTKQQDIWYLRLFSGRRRCLETI